MGRLSDAATRDVPRARELSVKHCDEEIIDISEWIPKIEINI